ncbi:MAG: DNA-directed RNA polymerase [Acidilobaceae archaeon]|nr:DNA-directed RNA polymerase [Acidilobaceae archaeon]MCX8165598.1 DNA-directed RNA polymerase [Acidilobaceae archaeon]MDW7974025.1 DNA-directed RNA polymerase [Sulfolobales archaeon]
MYVLYEIEEWIGIPPEKVYNNDDINAVALQILRDRLESTFDYELGIIIAVMDVKVEGEGYIIPMPNDPNAYFLARYKILAFDAVQQEVVKGIVRDVKEQGIFVDLGPVDGFVHRGQILDENLEMLPDKRGYKSLESNKTIEIGDHVRARITQISKSMIPSVRGLRIGMTMRQPYLGKEEWVRK